MPNALNSSPVAGTNSHRYLQNDGVNHLNAAESRQVWQALSEIARVVLELASAHTGESGLNHGTPCHTSIPFSATCPLSELIDDFMRVKAKTGRCLRYLRTLRVSLKSFAKGRAKVPIGNITVADIEAWLDAQVWAPKTQKGYLGDVRTLFNFAVRRQMLAHNPAAAVELPVQTPQPAGIHTPNQVRTVLEFARGYNLCICRALAVRYFAGLRSAEVNRLEEYEIKESFIEVPAAKAKTRRRRPVSIQPNLRAWLDLGGSLPLHDISNTWRWFTAKLEKAHGVPWPHNVTRHSFCSYHLQQFQNAGKTAIEAGHTEQMLFAHYRELVTPAAAAEYWSIMPK